MVVSGISLLISTSGKIIQQDKITFKNINKNESAIKWRESDFVLEYSFDDGFEIERPIKYNELPQELKIKFNNFTKEYDRVLVEKVYRFGEDDNFEFYLYKNNNLKKIEYNIKD